MITAEGLESQMSVEICGGRCIFDELLAVLSAFSNFSVKGFTQS